MFLRNYWYVGAYADEVTREPLGRVLLGEPVVFYRTEVGLPVALEDRCAHRLLPLSMGKVIGDAIQCHYHALEYDSSGACVRIPGQDRIPPQMKVKNYPVVERDNCIFVWMGDVEGGRRIQGAGDLWQAIPGRLERDQGALPCAGKLSVGHRQPS